MLAGTVVATLLALLLGSWSDGFAITGLALILGAVGWALGPFKTPMVWSEGALMAYQSNADVSRSSVLHRNWRVVAVPAFAFAAGALLLGAAAVIAAG